MSEQLTSLLEATEGWMAERPLHAARYHYIVGSMALCGGYGFYKGDLVPHVAGNPRGNGDCAKCHRRVNRNDRKLFDFAGQRLTLAEISERIGVSVGSLWWRLRNGWTPERAFVGKRAS